MHSPVGVGTTLILVIILAVAFDYVNGFHDTANAIATVVSTRVLTPRTAILMAAVLNFVGALVSQGVAGTITKGLVDPKNATQLMILAALVGAIIWNLITWRFGIPSSSSHALIGGLIGAAIAHAYLDHLLVGMDIIHWASLLKLVIIPLVTSPIVGFILGFIIMSVLYVTLGKVRPHKITGIFQRLQMVSAAAMAYSHGQNDAQKSMGIITMALVANGLWPNTEKVSIPHWVMFTCAAAMAAGTSAGGYRIIKTMGHRIIRLEPVQGFAAETAASITIFLASHFNMPVSTTHVISGSIFGVGGSKRLSAVRWGVAQSMLMAWVLTIPAAGTTAAMAYLLFHVVGIRH